MPENITDDLQRNPRHRHVACRCMAQVMEPKILNPGQRASVLEGSSHIVEGLSLLPDFRYAGEQVIGSFVPGQIRQDVKETVRNRNVTGMTVFCMRNEEGTVPKVDILPPHPHDFPATHSRTQGRCDDGPQVMGSTLHEPSRLFKGKEPHPPPFFPEWFYG
ncbi:MAG TPA: hypothetical protein VJ327_06505 [Patescibacteria group bacterium]|nr:hypothetical protein [Patescibacteria group bacterium]